MSISLEADGLRKQTIDSHSAGRSNMKTWILVVQGGGNGIMLLTPVFNTKFKATFSLVLARCAQ